MSWQFTSTKAVIPAIAYLVAAVLTAGAQTAGAQSLESAIMPGEVIQGHIKQEADCRNCHVRFDRAAQPQLCLDCHKDVARDVRGKTGFHGRIRDQERVCRNCHTEHKGRNARIVILDETTFDHAQTDFLLQGKHKGAACASCHRAKTKHSAAPGTCVDCHRKDDRHKDTLGAKCEKCHDEKSWKEARFDHAKTHFPLLLRHEKVKCVECHADAAHLADTPRECIACHRKDDKHKNTLSAKCEHCHNEKNWKETRFDHAKSQFPLLLRHAKLKCTECHSDVQHFARTPRDCLSCHRKDDSHKGALGTKCEGCHNEKTWKEALRFDHGRDTRFRLRDKHHEAKCQSCHKDARFRDKLPLTCFGCHERDDRDKGHKGRYSEKCESCHAERAFKTVTFEHEHDARYALRGKHARAKCDTCHSGVLYRDKLAQQCFSCHEKDDKHKAQLGKECERCHNERSWNETPSFDHDRSRFRLQDKHKGLECKKCHQTPAFKDAKLECASCHSKDDLHKERLGPRCEQCHNARGWKDWEFDHDLRSQFKLLDRHAKVKCLACHSKPVKEKVRLAADCYSCHRQDDIHFDTKGRQCERCHVPQNWRKTVGDALLLPRGR